MPITDKTHLYDLGGKVWLFPFLIKSIPTSKAVARRVASFVSRRVRAQAPGERPSYDEILAFLAAVERAGAGESAPHAKAHRRHWGPAVSKQHSPGHLIDWTEVLTNPG